MPSKFDDRIKLIGQVCMHNEMDKGNLTRCLDNLTLYCDEVIIYDDASTDDSVEVAERYKNVIVIKGQANDQSEELRHKQQLLDMAVARGATHAFWLDCDEVLTRIGSETIRQLCKTMPSNVDAYSFPELNLWRSQNYVRVDTLFAKARFVRLWKIKPGIKFQVRNGVHLQLYPSTIKNIQEAPFGVIHYGFWDYKKMLVKIGAHGFTKERIQKCAETNWILDERKCQVYYLDSHNFPKGCKPGDIWLRPIPKPISELLPYNELDDDQPLSFMDSSDKAIWRTLHGDKYHGDYNSIFERNLAAYKQEPGSLESQRLNLFEFSPEGKVICDIGAGGGWHGIECLRKGAKKVYLLETMDSLIEYINTSFEALWIEKEEYETVSILDDCLDGLPDFDVIYCMAVFMHIKFWQACNWMKWAYQKLDEGGELHLQLYQKDGETMFFNGEDSVSNIRFEAEVNKIGFDFERKFATEPEEPVWYIYKLTKRKTA